MLSVIWGLIVGGAGGATLWHLMAHNGVPHALLKKRWLDAPIAIAVATAIAFGIALVVAGLA